MKGLLNILGILLYFIIRYGKRSDKTQKFSATFWLNDNWIETVGTIVVNAILVILLLAGGITFDFEKWLPWLPDGIGFVGDLAAYAIIGAVISHVVYEFVAGKKKKEDPPQP